MALPLESMIGVALDAAIVAADIPASTEFPCESVIKRLPALRVDASVVMSFVANAPPDNCAACVCWIMLRLPRAIPYAVLTHVLRANALPS